MSASKFYLINRFLIENLELHLTTTDIGVSGGATRQATLTMTSLYKSETGSSSMSSSFGQFDLAKHLLFVHYIVLKE